MGLDERVVAVVADIEDVAGAVDFRQEGGCVRGDPVGAAQPPCGEADFELVNERGDSRAGAGRDGDAARIPGELAGDDLRVGDERSVLLKTRIVCLPAASSSARAASTADICS